VTRRLTVRSSVLFPQPEGPSSTVKLPAGTSKVTPSTAFRSACGYRATTESNPTLTLMDELRSYLGGVALIDVNFDVEAAQRGVG